MAPLRRLLLWIAAAAACVQARQPDPAHHALAAQLFEDSLRAAQHGTTEGAEGSSVGASAAVVAAAIDGLLQSGTVLLQAGHDERALKALDAVLRATPASPSGAVRQEHLLAMVHKLGAVRRIMTLAAAEAPPSEDEHLEGRWAPQLYWLDWVPQWEAGRGPVQRAAGCTDSQAAEALQHLQQLAVDLEVHRIRSCLVGFHGILLRRGKSNTLNLLQLSSVPDTSAPLLSGWALGLVTSDFTIQAQGNTWPFELSLAVDATPADFTGRAIVIRAAAYLQGLQPEVDWAGFGAASRAELEAARLWQSADELRHYEYQALRGSNCDGRPEVVRVGQLVSALGGYSLNYFHWMTEILPGLIRLLPLVLDDSSVRVLTHEGVSWSRSVLVDLLGISEAQLIEDDGCAVYEADMLYTWSSDNPLSPQLLEQSRGVLLRAAVGLDEGEGLAPCECCTSVLRRSDGTSSSAPSRRAVLLDRGKSIRGRRIANHADVAAAIADELPAEFEVCSLSTEKCSVPEQISCFASADLAVGVEGAGLTNALVMPRGATVVNLHPAHPDSSFSTLVSECGQSVSRAH